MKERTKKSLSHGVSFMVSEETYQRLQAEADRRDCSVDLLIREMIDVALAEKKARS